MPFYMPDLCKPATMKNVMFEGFSVTFFVAKVVGITNKTFEFF